MFKMGRCKQNCCFGKQAGWDTLITSSAIPVRQVCEQSGTLFGRFDPYLIRLGGDNSGNV